MENITTNTFCNEISFVLIQKYWLPGVENPCYKNGVDSFRGGAGLALIQSRAKKRPTPLGYII